MSLNVGNVAGYAIAGTNKLPSWLPQTPGCDLPQDGGIGGNLGKNNLPKPGIVLEERPAKYDFKTGEWVYVDEYFENLPGKTYLV